MSSVAASLPDAEPPARKLTARGRDRRQALLSYAIKRFAENGYHPTSVSDIVDGIGVGKGVFYWYFPSKDDMLLEILREALYDLRTFQQAELRAAEDPIQRLELGIRASLRWSSDHQDILRITMFCWTEETFAKALRKGRRIIVADTAKHVQAGIDLGLIAPGDPAMLATAIRGVTDELARSYAVGASDLDEEVVVLAVRMCLHGVVGAKP